MPTIERERENNAETNRISGKIDSRGGMKWLPGLRFTDSKTVQNGNVIGLKGNRL